MLIGTLLSIFCSAVLQAQTRTTMGWVEKIRLEHGHLMLHAKLDTGADYSSLDASDIEEFEKKGKPWVRFSVTDHYGKKHLFEERVLRTALIKKHTGKHQRRNVIRIGICVGKLYMKSEVNIVDRSNFKYEMLLGRNFLAGNIIVDSSSSFTAEPRCKLLNDTTTSSSASSSSTSSLLK